uniref:SFRICE_026299 n=1 Tax=Spodoptera frugiperda TaxID=7108 RepID=A0A2H1WMR3_SPOFR
MAARAAGVRGGKVEIRKEHTQIYKFNNFQNSRKTFQSHRLKLKKTETESTFLIHGASYLVHVE